MVGMFTAGLRLYKPWRQRFFSILNNWKELINHFRWTIIKFSTPHSLEHISYMLFC